MVDFAEMWMETDPFFSATTTATSISSKKATAATPDPIMEMPIMEMPIMEMPIMEMPIMEMPIMEMPIKEIEDTASVVSLDNTEEEHSQSQQKCSSPFMSAIWEIDTFMDAAVPQEIEPLRI